MKSLAKFPSTGRLGLGCVRPLRPPRGNTEEIVARAEEAMQYVDKSRITLHPDCGFAPSVQNPMDLDEAYLKLKSMLPGGRDATGEVRLKEHEELATEATEDTEGEEYEDVRRGTRSFDVFFSVSSVPSVA